MEASGRRLRLTAPERRPILTLVRTGQGGNMVKTHSKVGNSLGIVIDKPILELLGMDSTTRVELRADGESLIVTPGRGSQRERAAKASTRLMETHAETYRKLAK